MGTRIGFAVITQRLTTARPMLDFLLNAKKYGHTIECIIIGYTLEVAPQVVEALSPHTRVHTVQVGGDDERFLADLRRTGIGSAAIDTVFVSKSLPQCGRTTYARYRNTVVAAGLLHGIDHLYFFDTDVLPNLLLHEPASREAPPVRYQEIDFVGAHEEFLGKNDVFVTTSDYSGYYILPPMSFPGMEDFLIGIQKDGAYQFLRESGRHRCLNYARAQADPEVTSKLLGGNLGLDLTRADKLPPFYSTFFMFDSAPVLGRGEDTLMGPEINAAGGTCMDIDRWIFHNTFGDFPKVPDTREQHIRDRLYRGCLGWIARNPFLNWYLHDIGHEPRGSDEILARQRAHLIPGAAAAARAFDDSRFLRLPAAFDLSVSLLDQMIGCFRALTAAWPEVTTTLLARR